MNAIKIDKHLSVRRGTRSFHTARDVIMHVGVAKKLSVQMRVVTLGDCYDCSQIGGEKGVRGWRRERGRTPFSYVWYILKLFDTAASSSKILSIDTRDSRHLKIGRTATGRREPTTSISSTLNVGPSILYGLVKSRSKSSPT